MQTYKRYGIIWRKQTKVSGLKDGSHKYWEASLSKLAHNCRPTSLVKHSNITAAFKAIVNAAYCQQEADNMNTIVPLKLTKFAQKKT